MLHKYKFVKCVARLYLLLDGFVCAQKATIYLTGGNCNGPRRSALISDRSSNRIRKRDAPIASLLYNNILIAITSNESHCLLIASIRSGNGVLYTNFTSGILHDYITKKCFLQKERYKEL